MCTTQRFLFVMLVSSLLAVTQQWSGAVFAEETDTQYLSRELSNRIVTVTQGWGKIGIDTAIQPKHAPPMKLRIKDTEYERGLGHHADGQIVVDLAGQFMTFQADIGIQWQGGQDLASVIFRVFADDKKVFDSGILREGDAPRSITIPVAGVDQLTLVADDAGDGITCDCANWAQARLIPDPAATISLPAMGVDIAPFGRIVTWDPQRMQGTQAKRVDEFPTADVRLHRDVLPEADGTYRVPVQGEAGCIGLQWDENRLLRQVSLAFADAATIPPQETILLQIWSGESAWQGCWEPLLITPEQMGNRMVWSFSPQDSSAHRTQKFRWLFSDLKTPLMVKGIHAYSRSRWVTLDLRIEATGLAASGQVDVELYNGRILGATDEDPYRRTWDPAQPLTLKVRSAVSQSYKADRTVLRFRFPDTRFGVAVEDVLANDCVYVPHAGLFVTSEPVRMSRAAYLQKIHGQQTLLARVREKPDQGFAQAFAAVHNPIQDLGPMMLSLACDSRKFVVEREGKVLFDTYANFDDPERPIPKQWQLVPRFGRGTDKQFARHLLGGWLPVPVTTVLEEDIEYRQSTYVAPMDDTPPTGSPRWVRQRAVGVMEFSVKNCGERDREASVALTLGSGNGNREQGVWEQVSHGAVATNGDRLLVWLDAHELSPLKIRIDAGTVIICGQLPPGAAVRWFAYLPAWPTGPDDVTVLHQSAPYLLRVERYWNEMLEPAMQVELPDALLTNVLRASQVHCLLAARNEDAGRRISPWISSDRYGPLESEANAIIRGMGLMGHDEFARRSLDYFMHRYNEAGYLTTGYTMVGTGEHLWTLAEHYHRTQDEAWLRAIAPEVARACLWVAAQRAKTKQLDGHGKPVPEYGLFPPGVTADWNRYAYRFFNDAQYCFGLESAARILATVHHPDAPALLEDARQYRKDLVRAYHWTQARSPVVRLEDGIWVPADPALLHCPGRVEDFLPREDGNRSWAYSVEIGAHHLAAAGILDPTSPDVGWMMHYLEESQFLRSGMGDYPEAKNRHDIFNLGGFPKVQPYYGRIAEVYALRDDVKPFIRSYFNAIPSLLSLENLSFWEHFHNIGGWNKTHETGWFLCQSRILLVMERGDDLWLAPFATNAWLKDGMRIVVRGAPTRFGHVSYTLESAVDQAQIEATIEPPARKLPHRIVLRVRHPDGKPMQSVTVAGRPHQDFNPVQETVTLIPSETAMHVRVQY